MVNCPECGRFMRREEETTYTLDHLYFVEHLNDFKSHTHDIFVRVWLCGCGSKELIENKEATDAAHTAALPQTVNTFELPERF